MYSFKPTLSFSFTETIITETLKLLATASDAKFGTYLTPAHFLSLLDTQANWFTKWMHGHDCRGILVNSLSANDAFLHTSIASVFAYLNANLSARSSPNAPPSRKKSTNTTAAAATATTTSTEKRAVFRRPELDYTHFVHSLNVLRRLLCFHNGRRLFPVRLANKEVSLKDLIKAIIQLVFETAHFRALNEHSPAKYAFDLLQDLCAAEETCRACLCHEEVIEQLLKPLKSILQVILILLILFRPPLFFSLSYLSFSWSILEKL
jgi:hypothetical protein